MVGSEKQELLLTLAGREEEMRSHRPSFCYTNTSEHKPMRPLRRGRKLKRQRGFTEDNAISTSPMLKAHLSSPFWTVCHENMKHKKHFVLEARMVAPPFLSHTFREPTVMQQLNWRTSHLTPPLSQDVYQLCMSVALPAWPYEECWAGPENSHYNRFDGTGWSQTQQDSRGTRLWNLKVFLLLFLWGQMPLWQKLFPHYYVLVLKQHLKMKTIPVQMSVLTLFQKYSPSILTH